MSIINTEPFSEKQPHYQTFFAIYLLFEKVYLDSNSRKDSKTHLFSKEDRMGGLFGIESRSDCVNDLFFDTDYHSHLGQGGAG